MSEYRKITSRFWFDPKIAGDGFESRKLTSEEKVLFMFLITGPQGCSQTETGIYEVTIGEISMGSGIDINNVNSILEFFNSTRCSLLQYDSKIHMCFVKSFFRYNSDYLNTAEKMAKAVCKDFKKTGDKCPNFWGEFTDINIEVLEKSYKGLDPKTKSFATYRSTFSKFFLLRDSFCKKKEELLKEEECPYCTYLDKSTHLLHRKN